MHKRISRKAKAKRRPAVVSVAVITTSLLTIPAVEGFGSGGNNFGIIRSRKIDQPNRLKSDVVRSKLSYRSHDNAEEQQRQHEKATAELVETKRVQPVHHVSSFLHTMWTAPKSRRAREQAELYESQKKEQLLVDKYLESIDRRYKRLHKHDRKKQDADGVSCAWQWLMNGKDASCAIEEQRKQEDAIYVLGLAELASNKLLQKHHLPIPKTKKRDRSSSVVIDIEGRAMVEMMDKETNTKSETAVAASTATASSSTDVSLPKPDLARSLLSTACFCFQLAKAIQVSYAARLQVLTRAAKTFVLDGAKTSCKTISAGFLALASMAAKGGGAKYAIHFASVAAVSLISVLRPLSKA